MPRSKSKTTTVEPEKVPDQSEQNAVTLRGRLCFDPVLRHTASDIPVTNLRLAIQDTEPTQFITCVVWRRQAEVVTEFLRKGRLVEVTGFPRTREWTDQDGNARQTEEIVA
jgi:single-strand DNA-binding protein